MKKPTKNEKISIYEEFLHKINMFIISSNDEGIRELVYNADNWSYAHRRGEFITEKQRQKMINSALWNLCDTPNADKTTKERQRKYEKAKLEKEMVR